MNVAPQKFMYDCKVGKMISRFYKVLVLTEC